MTFAEFRNALCILRSIDMSELVAGGVIDADNFKAWESFAADPYAWLLRADDTRASRLWSIIEARQTRREAI